MLAALDRGTLRWLLSEMSAREHGRWGVDLQGPPPCESGCALTTACISSEAGATSSLPKITRIEVGDLRDDAERARQFLPHLLDNTPCILVGAASGSPWEASRALSDAFHDLSFLQGFTTRGGGGGGDVVPAGLVDLDPLTDPGVVTGRPPRDADDPFAAYVAWWRAGGRSGGDDGADPPYLKDLHLQLVHEATGRPSFYEVPVEVRDDWLNDFFLARNTGGTVDDYRFVYIGPRGSTTGWHRDVCLSHSWSANLCGRKEWTMGPPTVENDGDPDAPAAVFTQDPGDIVFVPSGHPHRVVNVDAALSVNHNWINAFNLPWAWRAVRGDHEAVCDEVREHLPVFGQVDWDDRCKAMARAQCGLGLDEYAALLAHALATVAAGVRRDSKVAQQHGDAGGGSTPLAGAVVAAEINRAAARLWAYPPFDRNRERWLSEITVQTGISVPMDLPERAAAMCEDLFQK